MNEISFPILDNKYFYNKIIIKDENERKWYEKFYLWSLRNRHKIMFFTFTLFILLLIGDITMKKFNKPIKISINKKMIGGAENLKGLKNFLTAQTELDKAIDKKVGQAGTAIKDTAVSVVGKTKDTANTIKNNTSLLLNTFLLKTGFASSSNDNNKSTYMPTCDKSKWYKKANICKYEPANAIVDFFFYINKKFKISIIVAMLYFIYACGMIAIPMIILYYVIKKVLFYYRTSYTSIKKK